MRGEVEADFADLVAVEFEVASPEGVRLGTRRNRNRERAGVRRSERGAECVVALRYRADVRLVLLVGVVHTLEVTAVSFSPETAVGAEEFAGALFPRKHS